MKLTNQFSKIIVFLILNLGVCFSAAADMPNAQLRKVIDSQRWFVPQFRIIGVPVAEQNAIPTLLTQLGHLPLANKYTIFNPRIYPTNITII